MHLNKLLLVCATLLVLSVSGQQTKSDSAGATAAVNAFHAAVQSGNNAAAMKLIAEDA